MPKKKPKKPTKTKKTTKKRAARKLTVRMFRNLLIREEACDASLEWLRQFKTVSAAWKAHQEGVRRYRTRSSDRVFDDSQQIGWAIWLACTLRDLLGRNALRELAPSIVNENPDLGPSVMTQAFSELPYATVERVLIAARKSRPE